MMEVVKGRKVHVLAVPAPFQGHVKPMMKLCEKIAKHGIKITCVNIQSVHDKLVAGEEGKGVVELVSIPEEPTEEHNPFKTLPGSTSEFLTGFVGRINGSNPDEKIGFMIADIAVGWVLDIAGKMGVQPLLYSPASAAHYTFILHIPKLLEDGVLNPDGNVNKCDKIILSDEIPAWGKDELCWRYPGDPNFEKAFFDCLLPGPSKTSIHDKWMLINTSYDLEPAACDLNPIKTLPIAPLLEIHNPCTFYPEDPSCLTWLDSNPPGSVIYVSFGSIAAFSQQQLDELALGLELSGRAFLWVVRSRLATGYPDGFLERVSGTGMIVEWAPQERVLSHPSVACFLSHCGWNSTLEGLCAGVPFLCWPCFGDQYHNQNYICDKWGSGLRINRVEEGSEFRRRDEIKDKIEKLFAGYDDLKGNALRLKDICARSVSPGGSSYNNFERFIDVLTT